MGQLIHLSERLADHSRPSRGPAAFFFALGCPISYLAAERVERALGEIEWAPIRGVFTDDRSEAERRRIGEELFAVAEREAEALRLPLIAPDGPCAPTLGASRAAVHAVAQGAGPAFALAASRLIFCGGFDADDPDLVAEAAAVAGLSRDGALAASRDARHDAVLDATARGLLGQGVSTSPAIRIGHRWFAGLDAVPGARSFTAARALYGPAV